MKPTKATKPLLASFIPTYFPNQPTTLTKENPMSVHLELNYGKKIGLPEYVRARMKVGYLGRFESGEIL
jgi:hypothetical protein